MCACAVYTLRSAPSIETIGENVRAIRSRAIDERVRARPRELLIVRGDASHRLVVTTATPALTVRKTAVCHNPFLRSERFSSSVETPNAPARLEAHKCTLLTDSGAAYIELNIGIIP